MRYLFGLGLLLTLALAQGDTKATTYLTLDSKTQPAWFICDGLNVAVVVVAGQPQSGRIQITRFDKKTGQYRGQIYSLGQPDAGAGQIYYGLSLAGKAAGFIHATNPGMLENPQMAFTEPITSLKLGAEEIFCRWAPGTRFFGLSARRTVLVRQSTEGTLIYQSFDFKNTAASPSLEIQGKARSGGFQFANQGYLYSISMASGQAWLSLQKGNQTVQRDSFIAYTLAQPH